MLYVLNSRILEFQILMIFKYLYNSIYIIVYLYKWTKFRWILYLLELFI